MSRSTYKICACPRCSIEYAVLECTFNNFTGWRQWSDGWGYGSLYNLQTALRLCPCGTLFWPDGNHFEVHGLEPSEIYENSPEPEIEPSRLRLWLKRWWPKTVENTNFKYILRKIAEAYPKQPIIHPVKMTNLYAALSQSVPALDRRTELEIRKWLWWEWNHSSRGLPFMKHDNGPEVSQAEKELNLECLSQLLAVEPEHSWLNEPNWMIAGDAYRQLGRFSEAIETYGRMSYSLEIKSLLIGMAEEGRRECIQIKP